MLNNNSNDMIDYAKAYAHGTLDGYNKGSEDNSYTESNLRSAYSHGYEYGVFLYCEELEPENLSIDLDGGLSAINE